MNRESARHPVNVGHLVMGIAFLAMVGVWALVQSDTVGGGDVRWLLPVPWVLAGLGGLVALAITGSRRWTTHQSGWVEPAGTTPSTETDTYTDTAGNDPTEEIR